MDINALSDNTINALMFADIKDKHITFINLITNDYNNTNKEI